MNKARGNMYPFVTHTWNPLAGECCINCSYCSTKRLKERYPVLKKKYSGPPRIEAKELNNLGKGNFIFVCAQNDLFAPNVHESIILEIHEHIDLYKENIYLIQSKNTQSMFGFYQLNWPSFLTKNMILCTTLETNFGREVRAGWFAEIDHYPKHVTIEPIMKFNEGAFVELLIDINPEQINIGADSNSNPDHLEPTNAEIQSLLNLLHSRLPQAKVVLKDNLKRLYNGQ